MTPVVERIAEQESAACVFVGQYLKNPLWIEEQIFLAGIVPVIRQGSNPAGEEQEESNGYHLGVLLPFKGTEDDLEVQMVRGPDGKMIEICSLRGVSADELVNASFLASPLAHDGTGNLVTASMISFAGFEGLSRYHRNMGLWPKHPHAHVPLPPSTVFAPSRIVTATNNGHLRNAPPECLLSLTCK